MTIPVFPLQLRSATAPGKHDLLFLSAVVGRRVIVPSSPADTIVDLPAPRAIFQNFLASPKSSTRFAFFVAAT